MSSVIDFKALNYFTRKFELGKNAATVAIYLAPPDDLATSDTTIYAPLKNTGITLEAGADKVHIRAGEAVYTDDETCNVFQAGLFKSYIDLGAGNNGFFFSHVGVDHTNIFGLRGESGNESYLAAGAGADTLAIRGVETALSFAQAYLGDGANNVRLFAEYRSMDNATLATGKHNDTVFLVGEVAASDIHLGDGANVLTVRGGVTGGSIIAGSGADKINLRNEGGDALENGTVRTGAGNDAVTVVGAVGGGSFSLGAGNDSLTVTGYVSNAIINLEAGNDILAVSGQVYGTNIFAESGANRVSLGSLDCSTIRLEGGADVLLVRNGIGSNLENSEINAGDGKNTITVFGGLDARTKSEVAITTGKDADVINIFGNLSAGDSTCGFTIDAGGGNNNVRVTTTGGTSNTIRHIDNLQVITGTGDDTIVLDTRYTGPDSADIGNIAIHSGAGNDSISLMGNVWGADINLESGNNVVQLGSLARSTVTGGTGKDKVYVDQVQTGAEILLGDGNDTLYLGGIASGASSVKLDGGLGTDVLAIAGAAHNVTSLERLIPATGVTFTGFEVVDLTNGAAGGLLVTAAGFAKFGTGMRIHGDKTDTVYLETGWALQGGTRKVEGVTYKVYKNGSDEILVQSTVKVLLPGQEGYLADAAANFGVNDTETISASALSKTTFSQGNDSVTIADTVSAGTALALGHGADTLRVAGHLQGAARGKITLTGQGDNVVAVDGQVQYTTATFGDGMNGFHAKGGIVNSSLTFGNGRNIITTTDGQVAASSIKTGTGNDDVSISRNADRTAAINGTTLDLGAGHNSINLNASTLLAGNDSLMAMNGGKITTGAGNDSLAAYGHVIGGNIDLGAGQNVVKLTARGADAEDEFGMALYSSKLTTGAGNDYVELASQKGLAVVGDSGIALGDGDNTLTIANTAGIGIMSTDAKPTDKITATVTSGTGNDSISITVDSESAVMYRASITDKGGDNYVDITGGNGLEFSTLTFLGKGGDTVTVEATATDVDTISLDDVTWKAGALAPHGGTDANYHDGTKIYDIGGVGLLGSNITFTGGDNSLTVEGTHAGVMGRVTHVDATSKKAAYDALTYAEIKLNGNGDNAVDISGSNYGIYGTNLTLGTGNDTVSLAATGLAGDLARFSAAMADSSLSITGGVNRVDLTAGFGNCYGAYNSTLSLGGESTLSVNTGFSGFTYSKVNFTGKGDARLEIDTASTSMTETTVTAGGNLSAVIRAGISYGLSHSALTVTGAADLLLQTGNSGFHVSKLTLNGTGNRLTMNTKGGGFSNSSVTSKGGDVIEIDAREDGFYGKSSLDIKGGNNLLAVDAGEKAANDSSLSFGGGNDTVVLKGGTAALSSARLSTGAGDDLIVLDGGVSGNYVVTSGKTVATHIAIDAGKGNDTIRFVVDGANNQFTAGAIISGGAGTDVLSLALAGTPTASSTVTLGDLFAGGAKTQNVEVLHVEKTGSSLYGRELDLTAADLANFASLPKYSLPGKGNVSAMRITGDNGVTLKFTDGGWNTNGQLYRVDGECYYLFENGAASVLVSAAVQPVGGYANSGPGLIRIQNGVSVTDMAALSGAEVFYEYGDTARTMTIGTGGTLIPALEDMGLSFGKGADKLTLTGSVGMRDGYVDLGEGNNTLIFDVSSIGLVGQDGRAVVRAGAGNDVLTVTSGVAAQFALIDLGDGNNRVELAGSLAMSSSELHLGKGNDTVTLTGDESASTINLGDGNNRFTLNGASSGGASVIAAGGGADNIVVTGNVSGLTIAAGEGKNTVSLGGDAIYLNLQAGSGNDLLSVAGNTTSGIITIAGGNNTLSFGSVTGTTVTTGNGADALTVGAIGVNSRISLGGGNDTLFMTSGVGGTGVILHGDDTLAGTVAGTRDVMDLTRYDAKVLTFSGVVGTSYNASVKGFEVISLKDNASGMLVVGKNDLDRFSGTSFTAKQLEKAAALDKTQNADLQRYLQNAQDSLLRMEGDTASGKRDTVYLLNDGGHDWQQVGTVTVEKVAYQVWSSTGTVSGSAKYLLVQNGMAVVAGTDPDYISVTYDGVNSAWGPTYEMVPGLLKSEYIGDSGKSQLYKITGTGGEDSVRIEDALKTNSQFTLGEGNDTLRIAGDLNGTANLGAGDDSLVIGGAFTGGTISAGAGADAIDITSLKGGTVDLGTGSTTLTLGAMQGGTIKAGTTGTHHVFIDETMSGGTVTFGAGGGELDASVIRGVKVTGVAGDDTVSAGSFNNAILSLGDGANSVRADFMTGGSITGGKGADQVDIAELSGVTVTLGAGNNTVSFGEMTGGSITTGAGDDRLLESGHMLGGAKISLGDGKNYVELLSLSGGSSLTTGKGADTVNIFNSVSAATVDLGAGDDLLVMSAASFGLTGAAKIKGGAGVDTLTLTDSGAVSLAAVEGGSSVEGVEYIQLGQRSGENVNLTISGDGLSRFTPEAISGIPGLNGQKIMRITGESGDSVSLTAADGWSGGGTYVSGSDTFTLYTNRDGQKVLIENGISVSGTGLFYDIKSGDSSTSAGANWEFASLSKNYISMSFAGNDNMRVTGNASGSTIRLGNGDNNLLIKGALQSGGSAEIDRLDVPNPNDMILFNNLYDAFKGGLGISGVRLNGLPSHKAQIYGGSGGDTITILGAVQGSICMGNGDNSLTIGGNVTGGSLSVNAYVSGYGRYPIKIPGYTLIGGGSGADHVEIRGAASDVLMDLGHGDNKTVFCKNLADAGLYTGTGDDTFRVHGNVSASNIMLGTGNNEAYIQGNATTLWLVAGKPLIGMSTDTEDLYFGISDDDSHSKVRVDGTVASSTITLCGGDDRVDLGKVTNSRIELGGGDDDLVIHGGVTGGSGAKATIIDMGAGDDELTIEGTLGSGATVNSLSGTLEAEIGGMSGGAINTGGGADHIEIGLLSGGVVNLGAGNDSLYLEGFKGGNINGGLGDDVLVLQFGQGAVADAAFKTGGAFVGLLGKNAVTGFEDLVLDMANGMENELKITDTMLKNITNAGGTVHVLGDAELDAVSLQGKAGDYTSGGSDTRFGVTMDCYVAENGAEIWVQQDIALNFLG
ncbi:hypothetical protein LJC26_07300 [Desulfovibrio sp. OttesenSCG-928-O18]|nr:hypothetical protein [Desulfovibrio sp. OttesenSCG-928-O18]